MSDEALQALSESLGTWQPDPECHISQDDQVKEVLTCNSYMKLNTGTGREFFYIVRIENEQLFIISLLESGKCRYLFLDSEKPRQMFKCLCKTSTVLMLEK